MRILLAGLMVMFALSSAQAQVRVTGAHVLHTGTYEVEKTKEIEDPNISSGHRYEADATLLHESTTITAKLNAAFGLEIMLEGTPRGKVVPVRIVWRYPDPGLQNPQTGKTKFVDDYMDRRGIGKKSTFYWMLGQEWALVPASSYGTKTAPWSVNRSGWSGNSRYSAGCTAALRASIETINDTRPSVARNITSAMIELTPSTRLKPPPLCSSEINAIAAPALTNSVK